MASKSLKRLMVKLGLRKSKKREPYQFARQDYGADPGKSLARSKVLNILDFTKTSNTSYSARKFPAGYHEIAIDGEVIEGQRKPRERIDLSEIDFAGKTVLDIGCNQGGMLFAIADQVKWAVGLDYDFRMVNAGNAISNRLGVENTEFYVFDIDNDPHELIIDFLPDEKVDIVFLLAVCMWVDRWRELIRHVAGFSDMMMFETNGSDEQQDEQYRYLQEIYDSVELKSSSSQDDPGQKRRKLYVCRKISAEQVERRIS